MDKIKYKLSQIVYAKLKPEVAGMVTAITFRPNSWFYGVTWSNDMTEKTNYECELTSPVRHGQRPTQAQLKLQLWPLFCSSWLDLFLYETT